MVISFLERASVPPNVLVRFMEGESVLLNLETERYFGLDATGTRMWQVVTAAPSVEIAFQTLLEEFHVDGAILRRNLMDLLRSFVENGLVVLRHDGERDFSSD